MSTKSAKNIYETFLFIFTLTFIGGFINAYTYTLHGQYLATMNTGNMARIGIAIAKGEFSHTYIYIMSIFANSFGAMIAYICREKIGKGIHTNWQPVCLRIEFILFLIIGFLPLSLPNFIVNFTISTISGFQLTTFTSWEGNIIATTIGSGNIRFIGENVGNFILHPTKVNFIKCILFTLITISFIFGVVVGVWITDIFSKFSIFAICALIGMLISIEKLNYKKLKSKKY